VLRTFGHGTANEEELAALIVRAQIEEVVDVRTVPRSRIHPHVWAERMALWVPERSGARYAWKSELGGFRKTRPQSMNVALRNANFRGYADYMQTPAFLDALGRLVASVATTRTAVMCSESVWWRCHRRLIADAAVLLHGVPVEHLMHDGSLRPHQLTRGVRKAGDLLIYDVPEAPED
jgi:uncharacterized protein (DUF488 family)